MALLKRPPVPAGCILLYVRGVPFATTMLPLCLFSRNGGETTMSKESALLALALLTAQVCQPLLVMT
jgi:hypothetical protein